MRRLVIPLLAVMLTSVLVLPAAAIPTSAYCADSEEQQFLKLINQFRAAHDKKPLSLTQTLGAASDHHSIVMANTSKFSHTLPGGRSWSQNMADHGYTYNTYKGENIAAGNATALATFRQWKRSSGHRANMLSGKFSAIGIGRDYDAGSQYGWYWTTDFGGVVDGPAQTC